jgi:iron only hydrogenase large subunit-like protein
MPCYDKKLEASRQDFYNDVYSTRDVDCVITTGELDLLMREKGWDLSVPVPGEMDSPVDADFPELISHPGTSSGSYLHSLISFLSEASPLDLTVRTVRSADYEEYTLSHQESGEVVFKGAKCYGFRNLQNVVRKVGRDAGIQVGRGAAGKLGGGLRKRKVGGKDKEKGYDYVEVMACPGGCVNGGGQLKPSVQGKRDEEGYGRNWEENGVKVDEMGGVEGVMQNAKWGDKEWTKAVEKAYWHDLPTPPATPPPETRRPSPDQLAAKVLVDLCRPSEGTGESHWGIKMDDAAEGRRRAFFRTQYRAVESEVIGLAVKW